MTSPRSKRRRRGVELTLSADAEARLRELARLHTDGTMSAVVEDLVLATIEKH